MLRAIQLRVPIGRLPFSADRQWLLYIIGLFLSVALIAGSHTVSLFARSQADQLDARTVLAERQRMLSQRMLFYAAEVMRTDSEDASTQLKQVTDLFERSHQDLITLELSRSLNRLYFESSDLSLDRLSERYIHLSRNVTREDGVPRGEAYLALTQLGQLRLPILLSQASAEFDQVSRQRLDALAWLQKLGLIAALAILPIQFLTVFMPAQKTASNAIGRLRLQARKLAQTKVTVKTHEDTIRTLEKDLYSARHRDPFTGLLSLKGLLEAVSLNVGNNAEYVPPIALLIAYRADLEDPPEPGSERDGPFATAVDELIDLARGSSALAHLSQGRFAALAQGTEENDIPGDLLSRLQGWGGDAFGTQVRIGCASQEAKEADGPTLLAAAAEALREAQEHTVSEPVIHTAALQQRRDAQRALVSDLHAALKSDGLSAFFQPQVSLEKNGLAGVELLVRWDHPRRGLLEPAEFLAISADEAVADAIDHAVLETGLDWLSTWRGQNLSVPRVAINASAVSLAQNAWVDALTDALDRRHLDPSDLTIEISETALSERGLRNATNLSQAGFRLVVDNFGNDFAGLSDLPKLPFDAVKIDRTVVSQLPDEGAAHVARALVSLAQSLGLDATAQGVQSAEHISLLRDSGCIAAQGFGIARPMSGSEFKDWLDAYLQT
ncbi:MAG: EAL domain-containing protein [Pseudomonadota bacterium]